MKEGHYMKYNQTYANLLSRTVEAYISTFYYKGYRIEVYQLDFNRKIYRVCKSYTYKILNNFFYKYERRSGENYFNH